MFWQQREKVTVQCYMKKNNCKSKILNFKNTIIEIRQTNARESMQK